MYVGRIVIVGRSKGRSFVAYRVSSRSFPNRRAEVRGQSIMVSPIDSADLARNPYIAYNCIRASGGAENGFAVVSNGTHTDMIFERIQDGQKPMDAIVLSLAAYGYERDELDTPRIAGAVQADHAWLGIARKDELRVKQFDLTEDGSFLVATYEKTDFEAIDLRAESAGQVAKAAYDLPLERPVCAAAAFAELANKGCGFELAVFNPR
ncbi:MAG: IMP cyclohydrolase [Methanothrix sp.]|nr:IMP cyclohydrolase [Methanothrix sp.]